MDPSMQQMEQMLPPSPMPEEDPAMDPTLTGPMAAPDPVMQMGGDSIAALLERVDMPDVMDLLRKQENERQAMLDAIDQQEAAASRVLMDRLAMMSESIDMPGGNVGGIA
jgi:hypothetical protein